MMTIDQIFDTSDFPARWQCGRWSDAHGWLHITSDAAIFGAYFAIPFLLVLFIWKRKETDVPFVPIIWLFAAFIFSCGFGHLIEASLFWKPWYRFSGLVKMFTAMVSWATVLALIPILPKALSLPGVKRLNETLESEVRERRKAELDLSDRVTELGQLNEELASFKRLAVGREERMIELKSEVNQLLKEAGRPPAYQLEFLQSHLSNPSG